MNDEQQLAAQGPVLQWLREIGVQFLPLQVEPAISIISGDRATSIARSMPGVEEMVEAQGLNVTVRDVSAAGAVIDAFVKDSKSGFRLPDVMRISGARLVEVGTTNRTRLADYRDAITPRTAMLLKVHASNYQVVGFTQAAPASDVAQLAHERLAGQHGALGPGGAGFQRRGQSTLAHTEYSRLLSEHGLFGVVALVALLSLFATRVPKRQSADERALRVAFMLWSLASMLHVGMRIAAIGLVFSWGCLKSLREPVSPSSAPRRR